MFVRGEGKKVAALFMYSHSSVRVCFVFSSCRFPFVSCIAFSPLFFSLPCFPWWWILLLCYYALALPPTPRS